MRNSESSSGTQKGLLVSLAMVLAAVVYVPQADAEHIDYYSLNDHERASYCASLTDEVITTNLGQQRFKAIYATYGADLSDLDVYHTVLSSAIATMEQRYSETRESAASGVWGRLKCNELYSAYLQKPDHQSLSSLTDQR